MSIFQRGISKYAYQGELTCPFGNCGSKAIRFVENVTMYRLRYRCRKCGLTFQYDISNRDDLNPYAPYAQSGGKVWDEIQRFVRGRKLKGALK